MPKTSEQLDEEIGAWEVRQKKAQMEAQIRRDRWELAWSVVILAATLVIAVSSIIACGALRDVAAELRRTHALQWTLQPGTIPDKEETDGGK